ncbi:MAG TPA: hypothetical protein VF610_01205 [Segetibacter sp.]
MNYFVEEYEHLRSGIATKNNRAAIGIAALLFGYLPESLNYITFVCL